jgi:hypothetical protein
MKTFVKIDLVSLSTKDQQKFLDFYQLHKEQPLKEIVDVWNKFAKGIHQYIFLKEISNGNSH